MSRCETCGGEGTVIEFRRFAGEYQAGEPVEVKCPECEGIGSEPSDDEDDDSGITLDELIAKHGSQLDEHYRSVVERDLKFTAELQRAMPAARAVAAAQSRRVSPSRPSGLPSLSQRKSA